MNRMLPFEAYYHVFNKWRNSKVFFQSAKGNFGDALLRRATWQIFDYFNISKVDIIEDADVVFWAAGGNMGPLYKIYIPIRKLLEQKSRELNKPFVILPQSWNGFEEIDFSESFVREYHSLKFSPLSKIAPDLALCYLPEISIEKPINNEGFFFRSDYEKIKELPGINDPAVMVENEFDYLRLAWSYKIIHTNRLHFAIAGMYANREVILYPNSYHKNKGVFELWLNTFGCSWRDNINIKV